MNIEDIAKEAIESIQAMSAEDLQELCRAYGHEPVRGIEFGSYFISAPVIIEEKPSIGQIELVILNNDGNQPYIAEDPYLQAA